MARNIFGYAHVSSRDQDSLQQLDQLDKHIADRRFLVVDEAGEKEFDRKGYAALVGAVGSAPLLHEGDLLVITSLDRLGRTYSEMRDQWDGITNVLKADIMVLDMPLLDTSIECSELGRRFVADLVSQLLNYFSEKERKRLRSRQRQGIDAMPIRDGVRVSARTGQPTGKPRAKYPDNWDEVYSKWIAGSITAVSAMGELNLRKSTFYSLANRYAEAKKPLNTKTAQDNR